MEYTAAVAPEGGTSGEDELMVQLFALNEDLFLSTIGLHGLVSDILRTSDRIAELREMR